MLATRVKKESYFDSIILMRISERLRAIPGVREAAVTMATSTNLAWMTDAGLIPPGQQVAAGPNDLIAAVEGDDDAVSRALDEVDTLLAGAPAQANEGSASATYHSMAEALKEQTRPNLAFVSVPGPFARLEAEEALRSGLHVHIFSDNVPLADERALKLMAERAGLLVMGPDCGTSIIAGKGLGFANRVRRGPVGIVGASGTGIQEVYCLLDGMGVGISHALGTGSHDLSDEVGGLTFTAAMGALMEDPSTRVIVLISKPPSPRVAEQIARHAARATKPTVLCFLGLGATAGFGDGLQVAGTLEDAARMAAGLSLGTDPRWPLEMDVRSASLLGAVPANGGYPGFVRGLFCGGTLCTEAQMVLSRYLSPVYSNASFRADLVWAPGPWPDGHLLIDLGDDHYTVGKPHPMIDGSERLRYLERALAAADTAVVLLDVILGSGAEPDPASSIAGVLRRSGVGSRVPVVVSLCGTEADRQGLHEQSEKLREAGAYPFRSNAAAARAVAALMSGDGQIMTMEDGK